MQPLTKLALRYQHALTKRLEAIEALRYEIHKLQLAIAALGIGCTMTLNKLTQLTLDAHS